MPNPSAQQTSKNGAAEWRAELDLRVARAEREARRSADELAREEVEKEELLKVALELEKENLQLRSNLSRMNEWAEKKLLDRESTLIFRCGSLTSADSLAPPLVALPSEQ